MRSVEFHPKAQAELISAARFFEGKSVNLGLTFIRTVQRTTQRIPAFSNRGRRFGRHLRRLLVPGFPYGLLYRVEPDRIFILAVMHLHRRPGYWRSRL